MCGHARGLRGRMEKRLGGGHGRQAASADRLRAGIKGFGDGGQTKIAMSRQARGVDYEDGRTGGRVQAIPTACECN